MKFYKLNQLLKTILYSVICFLLLFVITGCNEKISASSITYINTPVATGNNVFEKDTVSIDYSNTNLGYIMVECEEIDTKVKLAITNKDKTYFYDLIDEGEYKAFPLQMGDGEYVISVLKKMSDTEYGMLCSIKIPVEISNPDSPFLYPNQYVDFNSKSQVVKLSNQLCKGLTTDREKVEKIYSYIRGNIEYDYDEAESIESGYLPDLDEILETKKGTCLDYTALMAAMLRAQNISTKVAVGIVETSDVYHAWNLVKIDDEWEIMDPTFGKSKQIDDSYVVQKFY